MKCRNLIRNEFKEKPDGQARNVVEADFLKNDGKQDKLNLGGNNACSI